MRPWLRISLITLVHVAVLALLGLGVVHFLVEPAYRIAGSMVEAVASGNRDNLAQAGYLLSDEDVQLGHDTLMGDSGYDWVVAEPHITAVRFFPLTLWFRFTYTRRGTPVSLPGEVSVALSFVDEGWRASSFGWSPRRKS